MAAETIAAYAVILGVPIWLIGEAIKTHFERREPATETRGSAAPLRLVDPTLTTGDRPAALPVPHASASTVHVA